MQFEKIQNTAPKITELVMQALLTAIEQGQLKVGQELPPERELAASLGVGRSSLRECLSILEFLNIVEARGSRKVVVKDAEAFRKAVSFVRLSDQASTRSDDIEFRRVIEVAVVELACDRATQEDLERIEASLTHLRQSPQDYRSDAEFHNALAMASHNILFIATMDLLASIISDVRIRYFKLPNYYQRTLDSHQGIYDAVRARDKVRARREMEFHLSLVEEFMREAYALDEDAVGGLDEGES